MDKLDCTVQVREMDSDPTVAGKALVWDSPSPTQVENIRALVPALSGERGWYLWGPALSDKGQPKRPCWIEEGKLREDWKGVAGHSLAEALAFVGQQPEGSTLAVQGVGYAFDGTEEGGGNPRCVVLDFDSVIVGGTRGVLAVQVEERFAGTYIETSPSGNGLRVVCLAGPAGHGWPHSTGKRALGIGGEVEVFTPTNSAGKFFRLSGNRVENSPRAVTEQADALAWLVEEEAKAAQAKRSRTPPTPAAPAAQATVPGVIVAPQSVTDTAAWERLSGPLPKKWAAAKPAAQVLRSFQTSAGISKRSDIAKVMRGELGGNSGEGDPSKVDLTVCCEAIRRGAHTFDEVVEVWEATPAWREDKPGKRDDYVKRTVVHALGTVLKELAEFEEGGAGALRADSEERRGFLQQLQEAATAAGVQLTVSERGGRLKATAGNVDAALTLTDGGRGLLRLNEHSERVERGRSWAHVDRSAPTEPGPLGGADRAMLRVWLERAYGLVTDGQTLEAGMLLAAQRERYHPLRDRLDALAEKWDKVSRLDDWLVTHAGGRAEWEGTDLRPYLAEVGTIVLVGAVARVYEPGAKVDGAPVLVGKGGAGKSTLWRALAEAIGPDLFTDSVADVGDRVKLAENTAGRLIVELPEGAALRRSEVEALKAALSATEDTWRKPYSVEAETKKRGFVFVASANSMDFLVNGDDALRRRFYPIPCGGGYSGAS